VLRDETPEVVPVRTGISDGTVSEVVEGNLHAGDLLITDVSGILDQSRGALPPGPSPFRRIF